MRKQNGITLVSLAVTIILLVMITSIMGLEISVYVQHQNQTKIEADLRRLNEEIANYYSRNKTLPIINKYENLNSIGDLISINDNDNYYVIDLDKLGGAESLGLYYGIEGYNSAKEKDITQAITDITAIYIINEQSHKIYYPEGVEGVYEKIYKLDEITSQVNLPNITRVGLNLGDYVEYKASTDQDTYEIAANYSGYSENQTITRDDSLLWRILNISSDGSVVLVCEEPTDTYYGSINLSGATGYNNAVYLLNDVCEKLYSNDKLGIKARSANIEDFEANYNDTGIVAKNTYTNYSSTKKYDPAYSFYPNLYLKEKGSGINTSTVISNGIGISDKDELTNTIPAYTQAALNGITTTSNYYSATYATLFGNYDAISIAGGTYWIASRNVYNDTYAEFGVYESQESTLAKRTLYTSNGSDGSGKSVLRPIITIPADVKIELCKGTNTPLNRHIIEGL